MASGDPILEAGKFECCAARHSAAVNRFHHRHYRRAAVVTRIVNGEIESAKSAIRSRSVPVDCVDAEGTSALCAACYASSVSVAQPEGMADLIQYLLDGGADVTKANAAVSEPACLPVRASLLPAHPCPTHACRASPPSFRPAMPPISPPWPCSWRMQHRGGGGGQGRG